jgi:hypothetical protein
MTPTSFVAENEISSWRPVGLFSCVRQVVGSGPRPANDSATRSVEEEQAVACRGRRTTSFQSV